MDNTEDNNGEENRDKRFSTNGQCQGGKQHEQVDNEAIWILFARGDGQQGEVGVPQNEQYGQVDNNIAEICWVKNDEQKGKAGVAEGRWLDYEHEARYL